MEILVHPHCRNHDAAPTTFQGKVYLKVKEFTSSFILLPFPLLSAYLFIPSGLEDIGKCEDRVCNIGTCDLLHPVSFAVPGLALIHTPSLRHKRRGLPSQPLVPSLSLPSTSSDEWGDPTYEADLTELDDALSSRKRLRLDENCSALGTFQRPG